MQEIYTDKEILTDALSAEKAATGNYNTFANECVQYDACTWSLSNSNS